MYNGCDPKIVRKERFLSKTVLKNAKMRSKKT